MSWFAIVNPAAGRRKQSMHALEEQAALHGVEVEFVETTSLDQLDEVVQRAVSDGFTNFLAVGGDGTANTLVNSLMPLRQTERFTLGIVAAGSGSDWWSGSEVCLQLVWSLSES